ncbi:MAG: S1 RNA-binding domain-containing protein [Verrucomicrobia bacterium]|nr:S1 RNA-binding domain-containing protein [Verrucomicrobiota bacterium]
MDGGEHGEILLPNRYVPRGVVLGDRLDVFVYRDSADRLVATTETPRATVGGICCCHSESRPARCRWVRMWLCGSIWTKRPSELLPP